MCCHLCTFALWTAVVRRGRIPGSCNIRLSRVDCAVKGDLFAAHLRGLGEFPGAALGVSRLARSAYVRRLLTGKLPPVLSAWVDDASPYLYYVFRHRFGFLPADDSCTLTSLAPGV